MTMMTERERELPAQVRKRAFAAYYNAMTVGSPVRTMVSVFDGLIRVLGSAARWRQEGRRDMEFLELQKLVRTVQAMRSGLDFDHGGAMASSLSQYCSTVIYHALAVCRDAAPDPRYRSVYRQLAGMRDAWATCAGVEPLSALRSSGGQLRSDASSSGQVLIRG